MARRRLAGLLAVLSAGGCSASTTPVDAGVDASACQRDPRFPAANGPAPAGGVTAWFVIDAVTIDAMDAPGGYAGFDLDGLASSESDPAGCTHADARSSYEWDQDRPSCCAAGSRCAGGVDNQLPAMADMALQIGPEFDMRAQVRAAIAAGGLLLVVRMVGVDDWVDDADVGLELYAAFDADSDCANNFAGAGMLTLDARSFDEAGTPRWHAAGVIEHGRFRTVAPFDALAVAPAIVYRMIPWTFVLHDVQVRFDLAPGGASLARGNLGGWFGVEELVQSIEVWRDRWSLDEAADAPWVDLRIDPATQRIDPVNGVCFGPMPADGGMRRYGGISEGYGFTAVPVGVAGVATAPPYPPCAAGDGDAGMRD